MGAADEEESPVLRFFKKLDTDSSGSVERAEVERLFQALDAEYWNASRISLLLSYADCNKDDSISYPEFLVWLQGGHPEATFVQAVVDMETTKRWQAANWVVDYRHVVFDDGHVEMNLIRNETDNLGLKVDVAEGGESLVIREIKPGGVVAEWLKEHPEKNVKAGARIWSVNGQSGSAEKVLKKQLRVEGELSLEVWGEPGVESCGKPISDILNVTDRPIAEGQFGRFFKGVDKTTQEAFAVRSLSKATTTRSHMDSVLELMKDLDHPNIVRLYSVFEDFTSFQLVWDLCETPLFEALLLATDDATISEQKAASVMQQVFTAVAYLHSRSIVHKLICPEHVLIMISNPLRVKLGGLRELCLLKEDERCYTCVGDVHYSAPEMLETSNPKGYGLAVDLWSCGVLAYCLLAGYLPYAGHGDAGTAHLVKTRPPSFPDADWGHVSQDARHLVNQLLDHEPDARGTASEAIKTPWIRDMAPNAPVATLIDTQRRLRLFANETRFRAVALNALARNLSNQDLGELRDKFKRIDSNGDGSITMGELKSSMDVLGEVESESVKMLRQMIEAMDIDGDKRLSYTEFMAAAMQSKNFLNDETCWRAFSMFDHDRSGTISKNELAQVLEDPSLQSSMGEKAVQDALSQCDADNDGVLTFGEFMSLLRQDDESTEDI